MSDIVQINDLHATLKALRVVRHSFVNFMKVLTEGSRSETEEESKGHKFFNTFRMHLR